MKRNRIIVLLVFLIVGIALIPASQLIKDEHILAATTFFSIAVATLVGSILDSKSNPFIRYSLIGIAIAYLALGFVGLFSNKEVLEIAIYCMILGIADIIKGLVKTIEAFIMLKEKNKMCILFFIDSIVEITIGILMCIEVNEALKLHVILISVDMMFEGIIKFANEYVEERMEQKQV